MDPVPMLASDIPSASATALPVEVTTMDLKLFEAVTWGDESSLQELLISTNASIVQQVTPGKDTCIHIAAGLGHCAIVKMILRLHPQLLTEVNSKGETALHRATRAGHYKIVKLLIDTIKSIQNSSSNDIEAMLAFTRVKNKQMETALHIAVRSLHSEVSSSEMVRLSGLFPTLVNAVRSAHDKIIRNKVVRRPHFKIATLLIQEDPELLCEGNHVGESPLHMAAEQESFTMVRKMLESNHLSYTGPKDRTALHTAVIHERADITRLLLKQELVRKGDVNGRTPLHFASALGFCEIVEILLRYDLSTTCFLDTDGFAAIHLAATFGHLNIIKQFIQFQPDLKDLLDRSGQNLLQIAISSEQVNIVKYILSEKRFEELLYWRDEEGNTPLHHAVVTGNPYIVHILVRDKRIYAMAMVLNKKCCSALCIARSRCEQRSEPRQVLVLAALIHALPGKQRKLDILNYTRRHEAGNIKADTWNLAEESKTLMIVSALVVSVTFTAGLTISGGETVPQAKAKQFDTFIQHDCASLFFALLTVLILIPTHLSQYKDVIHKILMVAQTSTMLSLAFMTLAFSYGLDMIRPQIQYVFLDLSSKLIYLGVLLTWLVALKLVLTRHAYYVYYISRMQHPDTRLTVGEIIEWMNRKHEHVSQAP